MLLLANHVKKSIGRNGIWVIRNSRTWGDQLASLLWSISRILLGSFTVDPLETESLGTVSPELGDGGFPWAS